MPARCAVPLTAAEIVDFFDAELIAGTSPERLVERAARLAGGCVGRTHEDGSGLARDGRGTPLDPVVPTGARVDEVSTGGLVWATGIDEETATRFLGRLAVAVAVVERWGAPPSSAATPVEVLIDEASGQAARLLALSDLQIPPDLAVRVVLCSGPRDGIEELVTSLADHGPVLARTEREERTVLLLAARRTETVPLLGVPVGLRVAYGRVSDAIRAHETYLNARDAYRFTLTASSANGPYSPFDAVWISGAQLGGLAALCRLQRRDIEAVPDVTALQSLAEKHGDQILRVLEAYAATESLRRSAAHVHMHHNSVRYWVQRAEAELGYSLIEPYRRAQLYVSLCLLRLLRDGAFDSAPGLTTPDRPAPSAPPA